MGLLWRLAAVVGLVGLLRALSTAVVTNVATGDVITAAKMNTKLESPIAAGEVAGGVIRAMLSSIFAGATVGASSTVYAGPGDAALNATEDNVKAPVPYAGTIRNLRVRNATAQPATGSLVVTLRKNGVSQTVTVTLAASTAANTTTADTTNSFSVAAGDLVDAQVVNNASGASAGLAAITYELAV